MEKKEDRKEWYEEFGELIDLCYPSFLTLKDFIRAIICYIIIYVLIKFFAWLNLHLS